MMYLIFLGIMNTGVTFALNGTENQAETLTFQRLENKGYSNEGRLLSLFFFFFGILAKQEFFLVYFQFFQYFIITSTEYFNLSLVVSRIRLNKSWHIIGMIPSSPSTSCLPIMVYDFPAPVCPQANIHTLYPVCQ